MKCAVALSVAALALAGLRSVSATDGLSLQAEAARPRVQDRTHSLRIGGMVVALENTTLIDVSRRFGGVVHRLPHEHVWGMCLRSRDRHQPVTVVLQSSELGGPEHDVTGFRVTTRSTQDTSCATAQFSAESVVTDTRIRIGMPLGAFRRLQPHSRFIPRRIQYQFEDSTSTPQRVSDPARGTSVTETVDTYFGLRARFERERLTEFYAWQVSST